MYVIVELIFKSDNEEWRVGNRERAAGFEVCCIIDLIV